jgi:hypothetical protein
MPGVKPEPPNLAELFPAPAAFFRTAPSGFSALLSAVDSASCLGFAFNATSVAFVAAYKPAQRRVAVLRLPSLCAVALLLCLQLGFAGVAYGQGFGLTKKTIKLQRKMPAAVHLPGPGFDVQVNSHDAANADAARMLSDLLTTELQKYDKKLQVKPSGADEVIRCTIMTFQIPPPVPYTRNEVVFQKGKSVEQPVQYYKVTGSVSVTYQAKDGGSRVLDSDGVTAKYAQEFQAGTNEATGESLQAKVTNPFKRLAGKKTDESYGPPTPIELRQLLLSRAASQIASRLVNTDETLDVPLARGKMDEANNLAEKGLWQRDLETLEEMTPLSKPTDDAYRLYNIGVAYEALAYQSEDKSATEKFLEKAAINYGKAIDANPGEKQFAEPQTRIETAVEHYKRLQGGSTMTAKADAASAPPDSAPPAKSSTPSKASTTATGTRSATATAKPAAGKPPASASAAAPATTPAAPAAASKAPAKPAAPAAPALTNAQVIKMAKAGVDEDNILATIHDATAVDFDLTPDGLVNLASNGVKGKIVIAMRERAKRH